MTVWRLQTATLFYSLLASLTDIDLFVDVGSFDGREAFAVEARFPGVKCIAIEPDPQNTDAIRREIARRHSRIALETFAAGNENGMTPFHTHPDVRTPLDSQMYIGSILKLTEATDDYKIASSTIEVPIRRLDSSIDSISSHTKIALWIDVEG